MDRTICICQDFLTDAHKAQITAAAEAAGMVPHFFTTAQTQEAKSRDWERRAKPERETLDLSPGERRWKCRRRHILRHPSGCPASPGHPSVCLAGAAGRLLDGIDDPEDLGGEGGDAGEHEEESGSRHSL